VGRHRCAPRSAPRLDSSQEKAFGGRVRAAPVASAPGLRTWGAQCLTAYVVGTSALGCSPTLLVFMGRTENARRFFFSHPVSKTLLAGSSRSTAFASCSFAVGDQHPAGVPCTRTKAGASRRPVPARNVRTDGQVLHRTTHPGNGTPTQTDSHSAGSRPIFFFFFLAIPQLHYVWGGRPRRPKPFFTRPARLTRRGKRPTSLRLRRPPRPPGRWMGPPLRLDFPKPATYEAA